MDAAFETDDLLKLLTDALRRGPGSPQWQQAVARLADPATPNRDELQLLITVRERLESGKPYRQVRPGASFTRAVFEKIDADVADTGGGDAPRRSILPLLVAAVSLVVLAIAASVLLTWLSHGTGDVQELSRQLFVTSLRKWDFAGPRLPSDLDRVGSLALESRGGAMRPDRGPPPTYPPIGVAFAKLPFDLVKPICVEAQVNFGQGPGFVGIFAGPVPPAATGLGANEVMITCGANTVSAGGSDGLSKDPPASRPLAPGDHTLRLKISRVAAVAEIDGQLVWTGPHEAWNTAIVGVRFTKPDRGQEPAAVTLRVLGQ